jgi:hypothetical protein
LIEIEFLLNKLNKEKVWNTEPVFCYTSDIDWASEDVMKMFFDELEGLDVYPTLFVTHKSETIETYFKLGRHDRGIHPNFLQESSHGSSFQEIVETCISFAPESECFRSHRLFDVTDITHLLKEKYGFKYVSNLGTILQKNIFPILHESGLIHYPIFFEDGTHLYNELDLKIEKYLEYFHSPGIKIISFHPMNFVFNTPHIKYMRSIKDSMSRDKFNSISEDFIEEHKNSKTIGISDTVKEIVNFVHKNNYKVMSLKEIYRETIR